MKIIIPMAGMGKRMRPHTLTIPKPLIPIAGKSIVHRLVEDITKVVGEKVEEIAFVIGDFGSDVEDQLKNIAKNLGAKASIYYQNEPLGTAHAILCAADSLEGKIVVAFADTLFKAGKPIDTSNKDMEGIIWVSKIEDPRAFGVVKINSNNVITDFVEKPQTFVSDLAIIGIYYFRDGNYLREQLQFVIDNNIKDKGEYQLTSALENMKTKGSKFYPGQVEEWLDCGNKDATVYTNQRILEFNKNEKLISEKSKIIDSRIIEPCFVGDDVIVKNSIIGPHVSLESGAVVESSIISNSIIQKGTKITGISMTNSMVGNHAICSGKPSELSLGDYSTFEN